MRAAAASAPRTDRSRRQADPARATGAPANDADHGARAIGDQPRRAAARPGAGAAEIAPERPATRGERALERQADRADSLFARLVQQRDIIRDAAEFGDVEAMHQAFGRARELFAELIALGNEAGIDVSSSTDSDATTAAKERIASRVRSAYQWAALIEDALPGDQTI